MIFPHPCLPLAALIADNILGEPKRWHPLVFFGTLAASLEQQYNRNHQRLTGMVCWAALVIPPTLLAGALTNWLGFWVAVLSGWLALGGNSLNEHATLVQKPLTAGDIPAARGAVSMIVSRDTGQLDEQGISKAAVESVLENGSDAVIASLFWLLVAGAPGVVLHRLANTLDAMWGYRTGRYRKFGWFAARADDALNFFPARITALLYALAGNTAYALRCWRDQSPDWHSPNAGAVMASGAGALGVRLGGAEQYHGKLKQRPELGFGKQPAALDIGRSTRLVNISAWFFALASSVLGIAA